MQEQLLKPPILKLVTLSLALLGCQLASANEFY